MCHSIFIQMKAQVFLFLSWTLNFAKEGYEGNISIKILIKVIPKCQTDNMQKRKIEEEF